MSVAILDRDLEVSGHAGTDRVVDNRVSVRVPWSVPPPTRAFLCERVDTRSAKVEYLKNGIELAGFGTVFHHSS